MHVAETGRMITLDTVFLLPTMCEFITDCEEINDLTQDFGLGDTQLRFANQLTETK